MCADDEIMPRALLHHLKTHWLAKCVIKVLLLITKLQTLFKLVFRLEKAKLHLIH